MGVPTLSSTSPIQGATNVDLNAAISALFSEAMDEVYVIGALVQLRNVALDEVVDASLSLSSDGLTITLTPARLLIPNSTYKLTLVGANTAGALGALQSTTGDDLTTTQIITFTTGEEISTSGLAKTEEESAQEGDLSLPSNVKVTPGGLSVLETTPKNHSFGNDLALDEIMIRFSDSIDSSLVNEETVDVDIFPFFEEDKHYALDVTRADGTVCGQFEFEGTADPTGGPLDFTPPSGTLSVTGNKILWTRDTGGNPFPYNACVEITLDSTLADTGGNTLGKDKRFTFCSKPFPDWVKIRKIRHKMYPIDISRFADDFIGLTLWTASMEIGNWIRWALEDLCLPPRTVKQLLTCKTVAEMFYVMQAEHQMKQGQYKRLGDFEVEFRHPTSRSADTKPAALQEAESCIEKLKRRLTAYWHRPRAFVKGVGSTYDRPDYRRRLWRQALAFTNSAHPIVEDLPGANLGTERHSGTPGAFDPWS